MANKSMVDTYKELTFEEWKAGPGAGKIKQTKTAGTKGESALDVTENRAMYNAYLAELRAGRARDEAVKEIEANQRKTMYENGVMEERAKEYVERRAMMNGTATAGVSQTAMVDLLSQMAESRAKAQAEYDGQKNTAHQAYLDAISRANDAANQVSAEVEIKRAEEKEVARKNKVTDILNAIADYRVGNISKSKLKEIYEANKGYINEQDAELKREYEGLEDAPEITGAFGANKLKAGRSVDLKKPHEYGAYKQVSPYLDVYNDSDQQIYTENLISKAQKGVYTNGTIIDMNKGAIAGDNKGNYWLYYDGVLYQTDLTYDEVYEAKNAGTITLVTDD